jgi:hypothetical protein
MICSGDLMTIAVPQERSNAAPSGKLPETAQRAFRASKTPAQGLIHIVAELGWPTAYPKPGPSVTTTLYA